MERRTAEVAERGAEQSPQGAGDEGDGAEPAERVAEAPAHEGARRAPAGHEPGDQQDRGAARVELLRRPRLHLRRLGVRPLRPAAAVGPAPEAVGQVIAGDRAGRRRENQRHHAEPTLPGQHPAEDDGRLAGKHGEDDVQGRQGEDHQVGVTGEIG